MYITRSIVQRLSVKNVSLRYDFRRAVNLLPVDFILFVRLRPVMLKIYIFFFSYRRPEIPS
jgi:hypothetical protein